MLYLLNTRTLKAHKVPPPALCYRSTWQGKEWWRIVGIIPAGYGRCGRCFKGEE